MQIEGAKAELRARPDHEASDLGLLVLRALFRPAFWAWVAFVLPLLSAVLLLCAPHEIGLSYLAVWWLKPVYDRAFGLVLGRGLFGEPPSVRQLYYWLWKDGKRGLIGDLTWRRLDPARTLVAPVALLEGFTGMRAARRRKTLSQGSTGSVLLLAASCTAIELAVMAGLLVGAALLLPEETAFITDNLTERGWDTFVQRGLLGSYVLAVSVVEPLFVAAGFGLYINRRTQLEGWDVELTFRRMARRLSAAGTLLLICALPLHTATGVAHAQEPMSRSAVEDTHRLPAPELAEDGRAAAAMERVLARPELARERVEEEWQLREQTDVPERKERPSGFLLSLVSSIASLAELLLWLLAGLTLAVTVALIVQRIQRSQRGARPDHSLPEFVATVTAGDVRPSPLALHEVVPRALDHLARGEHAAALSVLYVGTLSALVMQDGLALMHAHTEGQCLGLVRSAAIASERRSLFEELTQAWLLTAYAHSAPQRAQLEAICQQFRACFEGAP